MTKAKAGEAKGGLKGAPETEPEIVTEQAPEEQQPEQEQPPEDEPEDEPEQEQPPEDEPEDYVNPADYLEPAGDDVPENTLPGAERLYLRSRVDGHLFGYSEEIAHYPDLDTITESEAYPERHVPDYVKDAAEDAPDVDLGGGITPETGAEKEPPTDPALAKQAAKGWPTGR